MPQVSISLQNQFYQTSTLLAALVQSPGTGGQMIDTVVNTVLEDSEMLALSPEGLMMSLAAQDAGIGGGDLVLPGSSLNSFEFLSYVNQMG